MALPPGIPSTAAMLRTIKASTTLIETTVIQET